MCSWVVKSLYIVDSGMFPTYDVDKTHNSIVKIPLLASRFLQNGHDTLGEISKQKLATTNSFHILGGSFFAHPSS